MTSHNQIASLPLVRLGAASPVLAHGTVPGGGFASGVLLPFLAKDQLLLLISIGVPLGRGGLAERNTPARGRSWITAGAILVLAFLVRSGLGVI